MNPALHLPRHFICIILGNLTHFRRWLSTVVLLIMGCVAVSPSAVEGVIVNTEPTGFVAARPHDIKWISNPEIPGLYAAVLLGDPSKPGPLIFRVRLPANIQIEPHTHPDARTYTILDGAWKLGFGKKFDAAQLQAFPAGSIYRLPENVPHFQAAGPEGAIIQIESIGPTSDDFLDTGKKWLVPDNQ